MEPMQHGDSRGFADLIKPEGLVEILVYHGKKLVDSFTEKNIILYQGNAEIIRSLSTISPSTKPRIITRMAAGDQGTIPSDTTVPKVPVKTLTSLYHEIYRKDVDDRVITTNSGTSFVISGTLVLSGTLVTTTSTSGIAPGMSVSGTGITAGTIVQTVSSGTQFLISNPATVAGAQTLTISGAANECKFIATFNAVDVALSAYSNPSQPRINEIGLVIIDPTAVSGIVRSAVTAPTVPPADEVLMSIRTFKSVPFEIANDVSITIRYTIFLA